MGAPPGARAECVARPRVCGADLQIPTPSPSGYPSRAMKTSRPVSFLIAMLTAAVALATSHPWSDYDDTRGTWIRGTIRSSSFERPHQVLELEQDGAHSLWRVVLASPSKMESRGLRVASLVPGLRVRVYVYPAIDVPDEGRALRIDVGGQITELW